MRLLGAAVALLAGLSLSGCANMAGSTSEFGYPADHSVSKLAKRLPGRTLPAGLSFSISAKGMDRNSPIMIRIYKDEDKLEVWKQNRRGKFVFLKSYDICKFSGKLGPKTRTGDRQAPEGFYSVTPAQLNPASRNHLAFNMGYPNQFDRANGRTGYALMVHGGCTSIGCYAMTHKNIDEIYTLATDAFKGGQDAFQVQAFPFRMTNSNLARYRKDKNYAFWKTLKEGADHFEVTSVPPKVGVCDRRYVFNARARLSPNARCPNLNVPVQIASAVARRNGSFGATLFASARDNAASSAHAYAPAPAKVRTPAQVALDEVFTTRW